MTIAINEPWFEVNMTSYKCPDMTNALIKQLRDTIPWQVYIRVWENSPTKVSIVGADEVRWNRFNPSLSRIWNWAMAQSQYEYTLIPSDDILMGREWYEHLFEEVSRHPRSLIHGPSRCFLISRRVIDTVGWFDERMPVFCYEDLDFIRRLNNTPGAEHHYGPKSCLSRDNHSLWEQTGRSEHTRRGENLAFFKTKYRSDNTEDFHDAPLFNTPDFYPMAPREGQI